MAKQDFPVGTLSRLRNNTGINFSKAPTAPTEEESPLKKAVAAFALENSCDIRAAKKKIRCFYHYKLVLWMLFRSTHGIDVSYSTFCRYWPENIVKPKIEDFGPLNIVVA